MIKDYHAGKLDLFSTTKWALPLIVVVVLLVYAKSLSNGILLDDVNYIFDNSAIHNPSNILKIFTTGDSFGSGLGDPYYRPITTLSFYFNSMLFGDDTVTRHFTSVILHILTTILLYFTLKKLSRPFIALLGALLFAVHPANVEPVSYLSARADLLCGFFTIASFLFYLRYDEERGWLNLAASLTFLTMATMSKEPALMLPAAIALHMVLRRVLKKNWKVLLLLLAPDILYWSAKLAIVGNKSWFAYDLYERLATAGVNMATTILASLFPINHQVSYPGSVQTSFLTPDVMASWLVVGLFAIMALALVKVKKEAAFGMFWFLITLIPTSGIAMLLYPNFIADRYLYLPLMGLAMAFSSLSELAVGYPAWKKLRLPGLAAMALILTVFSLNSFARTGVWKDGYSFWKQAYQDNPHDTDVVSSYASANMMAGNEQEANKAFNLAILQGSDNPATYSNFALHNAYKGNFAKALEYNKRAMTMYPGDWSIINTQGHIYMMMGYSDEAVACFRRALKINPYSLSTKKFLAEAEGFIATSDDHMEIRP